ncbi:MAG: hypothetical protein RIC55_10850 [Pirellulaceae bacterium]
MSTFDTPEGETYFAASLEAGLTMDPTEGRDIVVLFDTSASQTGVYRDDAMTALNKLLESLPPKDRVKLLAVDLNAVEMTEDFVSPKGTEIRMGLQKLQRRLPLGSTDMAAVITAAADAFMFDGGSPRVAVYIGDGMTRANVLTSARFAQAVDKLVERRVSVSSYVIGPSRGMQLLAALANQTGGMMIADSEQEDAGIQAGVTLSHWVHATVAWPTKVNYSAGMVEVLPSRMPPFRSDRDTILIGKLSDRGEQSIDATVEVAGKPQDLTFTMMPEKSNADVAFVPRLVNLVGDEGGVSLPTVGTLGLREAGRVMMNAAETLTQLGGRALASGDSAGAKRLAGEALLNDPSSPGARALDRAASAGGGEPGLNLGGSAPPVGIGGGDDLLGRVEEEGFFLEEVTNAERVLQEQLELLVKNGLQDAREKMGTDSIGAKEDLKLLLEQVEKAPHLEADVRLRLRSQIELAIREASRLEIVNSARRAEEAENRAAAEATEAITLALNRKEEKIKHLTERFNSLMDEGRYEEAHDQVALQVRDMIPFDPTGESQVWWAQNRGNVVKMALLREVRHRKFVDALFQVEKSHVPFPDEPPIVYPDPEVWEELTLRRKKYASVDLAQRGPAEQRIFEELEKDTTLEYIETPLSDVIDYLEDLHNIQIELDTPALDAVGIGSDTPITRNLKGISLRSALRLMLSDLDLTYMVRDEVLQITTTDRAAENLITKVYPVGDLVLPISNQAGANPFLLGGGLGGMGGFGGGLGGGMGGGFCMGGMCGGGFGGMMGGGFGFMDVEDDLHLDRFEIINR